MGGKTRKPFLELRGRPILSWTVSALARIPSLQEIVLVTRPEDKETARAAARLGQIPKRVTLTSVNGGARRQDSVYNGLTASSEKSELVLIHDGARPFPPQQAMLEALTAARQKGGAILAMPMRDTVKRQKRQRRDQPAGISETVPRQDLWLAQTPQIFQRKLILRLFDRLIKDEPGREMTDDAAVCEHFGKQVALIEASSTNFKVTRPEDLPIAEAYLKLGLVK